METILFQQQSSGYLGLMSWPLVLSARSPGPAITELAEISSPMM